MNPRCNASFADFVTALPAAHDRQLPPAMLRHGAVLSTPDDSLQHGSAGLSG
jgi:hypothetical protein